MKKQLIFISFAIISSLSIAQIPTTGLVSKYRFEGSLSADSAGSNTLSTNNNPVLSTGFQNVNNTGVSFNADGILGSNSSDFQETSFTLSCWVNLTSPNLYQTFGNVRLNLSVFPYNSFILCAGTTISNKLTFFYNTDAFLSTGNPTSDLYLQDQTGALTYGTWYHVAVAVNYNSSNNSSTINLYKNGALVNTVQSAGQIVYNGSPFSLGNINGATDNNNGLKGSLDEVLFYNRALTQGELCEIYNFYLNTNCNLSVAAPTNLTASANGTQVTLNWTDNSNNESYFRVSTSIDGVNFTNVLGDVAANTTTYSYSAPAGTNYYRVYAYNGYDDSPNSNIASVTVTSTANIVDLDAILFSLYPNPTEDVLNIKAEKVFSFELLDFQGKVLASQEGSEIYTLSTATLQSGVYFIKSGTTIQKFFKL